MLRRTWWLVAALLLPFHAYAQQPVSSRPIHIGFGGGLSVPVADAKDAFKNGVHGQGFVSFGSAKLPIGGRLAVNYSKYDWKSLANPAVTGSTTLPTNGSSAVLSGLANLTYGMPMGPIKPYLLAGLGAFSVSNDVDAGSTSSDVHFGINGGAGLEVRMGPISGFLESRFENVYTDKGLSGDVFTDRKFSAQFIPVTFGLVY